MLDVRCMCGILLIERLVKLPCVHLIYVMTENINHANNSKIQKLFTVFLNLTALLTFSSAECF